MEEERKKWGENYDRIKGEAGLIGIVWVGVVEGVSNVGVAVCDRGGCGCWSNGGDVIMARRQSTLQGVITRWGTGVEGGESGGRWVER